jgi:hypothetical protein
MEGVPSEVSVRAMEASRALHLPPDTLRSLIVALGAGSAEVEPDALGQR